MMVLRCLRSDAMDFWGHSLSSLMWLSKRGIRASRLQMTIDSSLVRGSDILLVDTSDIDHLGLRRCHNVTDQCMLDIVNYCHKLQSIYIGSEKVTDAGVIALVAGCGQLQSINLASCGKVTDAGVRALSAGCGQLQSIDLKGCYQVTDTGVIALGAGRGQLQCINLAYCGEVTDAGVIALGAGCGQLHIVLDRFDKLTDKESMRMLITSS